MNDATPSTRPFEQVDALAYVEIDRFCPQCSYNLRGQAVRKETHTELFLCKCPECGAFTPAGDSATALNPWFKRIAFLLASCWGILCVAYLPILASILVAISVGTIDELTWIEPGSHFNRYHYYNYPVAEESYPTLTTKRNVPDHLYAHWVFLRRGLPALVALFTLVMFAIWVVIVPHWKRIYYLIVALILPSSIFIGLLFVVAGGGMWRLPTNTGGLLVSHLVAGVTGAVGGCYAGRPLARLVIRVILVPRLRSPFVFLWLIDGKTPTWVIE